MSEFSITVVIPTYNRNALIKRALDSVYAQTRAPDEVIVIDDGSNDDTEQMVKNSYPDAQYIYQTNQGVSKARNVGIERSTSNWICLLDSDDSWHEDKLEKQVAALTTEPDYRLCHTNETWYRHGVLLNQKKKHKKYGGNIFQHCLPLCAISPSSVIIQRSLFDEVGVFDESLPACEDYDMWLRICCRYPVLFLDEPLVNKYGGHADQLSQQYWGMDRFRIQALSNIIESNQLLEFDRAAAIDMLIRKIDIFLLGAEKHGNNEYSEAFTSMKARYA